MYRMNNANWIFISLDFDTLTLFVYAGETELIPIGDNGDQYFR